MTVSDHYPHEFETDDYCAIHGHEPLPNDWYTVCGECGHCYLTADELIEEDRKIRERMGDTNALPMRAKDIVICPLCTHDF